MVSKKLKSLRAVVTQASEVERLNLALNQTNSKKAESLILAQIERWRHA